MKKYVNIQFIIYKNVIHAFRKIMQQNSSQSILNKYTK